ncbi:hypothetical protein AMECASPLE_038931 [Ameca splendens]|uniref:Uncharacterized protein n=1 Tax=Ameca splendens TaxID=208324 RepID=A0ABV0Z6Z7_9TELE
MIKFYPNQRDLNLRYETPFRERDHLIYRNLPKAIIPSGSRASTKTWSGQTSRRLFTMWLPAPNMTRESQIN